MADSYSAEPSAKVFVGNLPWAANEDEMRGFFNECGVVQDVYLVTDRATGRFAGRGFVEFDSVDSATKAVEMNDMDFLGRPIRARDPLSCSCFLT